LDDEWQTNLSLVSGRQSSHEKPIERSEFFVRLSGSSWKSLSRNSQTSHRENRARNTH